MNIPYAVIISGTSNIPQNEVGNYVGLYSWSAETWTSKNEQNYGPPTAYTLHFGLMGQYLRHFESPGTLKRSSEKAEYRLREVFKGFAPAVGHKGGGHAEEVLSAFCNPGR